MHWLTLYFVMLSPSLNDRKFQGPFTLEKEKLYTSGACSILIIVNCIIEHILCEYRSKHTSNSKSPKATLKIYSEIPKQIWSILKQRDFSASSKPHFLNILFHIAGTDWKKKPVSMLLPTPDIGWC